MLAHLLDTIPASLRQKRVLVGPAAASRSDVRFMRLQHSLIRYRQVGERGPVIVFATDPPVLLEQYDELLEALAGDYRVIVFEAPGFGFSLPSLGFNFGMDRMLDSLTEFLERLAVRECTLAFPCVLGFVAIGLGHRLERIVKRVVVMQQPDWSGAQQWREGRDPKGILQTPVVGQLAMHALKKARMKQWFFAAVAEHGDPSPYVDHAHWGFDHGACFCLASGFQAFLGAAHSPVAPLNTPALAVWGMADRSHRKTIPETTLNLLPNASLVKIDKAGHFPELETAAEFTGHLRAFLEGT